MLYITVQLITIQDYKYTVLLVL